MAGLLVLAAPLGARTPEVAVDPKEGVWIAAGEVYVQQARDRWSVFPASDVVNELIVDDRTVWVATDDGVIRFESESRRAGRLTMDDGLPSQRVSAVAFDEQYVWFGTNKGLARYRKIDRELRVYTEEQGLPDAAVNDALLVGRQVWFATRGGLAVYDPEVDGLRAFTTADGLASDYVEELYQAGDDIWCVTDAGLSRYQPQTRVFTNFSFEELGGEELRAFVPDGERIWIGTEGGLVSFEAASDALIAFPQQDALEGRAVVGIEPFTDYLFITTEVEVVQFHKEKHTFRRFTAADGVAREAGAEGTLLSSGRLVLLFEDGAELYDIQRDLWYSRALEATEEAAGEGGDQVSWQLWTKLDSELPYDLQAGAFGEERFATLETGMGAGVQFADGRSLDLSLALDYGELELEGIRDLRVHGEYLGTTADLLREVVIDDQLKVQTVEEGLERSFLLQGAHARAASDGEEPAIQVSSDAGLRRGASVREYLTGPRQEIYTLQERYILPGTERVYVDGELLTAGVDYTVIYPAGQLAFLDPERVDDLSVIEVEYEYDLMPRKGLGVVSILDLVPADREVGGWVRGGEPTLIHEESGLYAQIDGAAPKYIDRGWVRSVYIEYRHGGRTMQLAIHDMGDEESALELYNYDLPPAREPVGEREFMVLDVGLATSYAVKAISGSYYIELSIDEKSDVTKQSIKLFAVQVVERGETAGEHTADDLRELVLVNRVAATPVSGLELGGRVMQVSGVDDPELEARSRHQTATVLDGRFERAVGSRGRVTGYGEAAATHRAGQAGNPGWATMGRLRFSHPYFEGAASGRYHDERYAPLGSDQTLYGRLQDEARVNATAYPARWLPTTLFYTRQTSRGLNGGTGQVQHALARVQLTEEHLPATRLQLGHSLLDDPTGLSTARAKAVAQADYDLAGPLSFLGVRRFLLRGLYGISDAETTDGGRFTQGDRVETTRLEAKLAPTATETAYALFRARAARRQAQLRGDFDLIDYHYELNAGARSAFVPGLIPQLNYAVLYDDLRLPEEDTVRVSNGTVSARLGVYPGDWWSALAPFALDTRYSLGNEEKAEDGLRTVHGRLHRVDNRFAYNGVGKLELELYQLYEVALAGQDQAAQRERLELRNRAIYRPVFTSPITARFDVIDERSRNDLELVSNAPAWGEVLAFESGLEWLMRWSQLFATKVKGTYGTALTEDLLFVEEASGTSTLQRFRQHQVTPEVELRFLFQGKESSIFLLQRDRFFYLFGSGEGAAQAWGFEASLGAIWRWADNLYLDVDLAYRQTFCLAEPCAPAQEIRPRLLLSAKL